MSLDGPPPIGRVYHPTGNGTTRISEDVDRTVDEDASRPGEVAHEAMRHDDEVDDDPRIQIAECGDIVPRRPGAIASSANDDGLWSSHHFWKGVVVGALIAIVVKTALAVRAPYGIDWFSY